MSAPVTDAGTAGVAGVRAGVLRVRKIGPPLAAFHSLAVTTSPVVGFMYLPPPPAPPGLYPFWYVGLLLPVGVLLSLLAEGGRVREDITELPRPRSLGRPLPRPRTVGVCTEGDGAMYVFKVEENTACPGEERVEESGRWRREGKVLGIVGAG